MIDWTETRNAFINFSSSALTFHKLSLKDFMAIRIPRKILEVSVKASILPLLCTRNLTNIFLCPGTLAMHQDSYRPSLCQGGRLKCYVWPMVGNVCTWSLTVSKQDMKRNSLPCPWPHSHLRQKQMCACEAAGDFTAFYALALPQKSANSLAHFSVEEMRSGSSS